jgi:hypothetical protein
MLQRLARGRSTLIQLLSDHVINENLLHKPDPEPNALPGVSPDLGVQLPVAPSV